MTVYESRSTPLVSDPHKPDGDAAPDSTPTPGNSNDRSQLADVPDEAPSWRGSLLAVNAQLDALGNQAAANETMLRRILGKADEYGQRTTPLYWQTLARIAELTLITAGAYADGCEFQAAGDLLVNPYRILIHLKSGPPAKIKNRHASLSAEFKAGTSGTQAFKGWFRENATLEIAQKALLPELVERMETSASLPPAYLDEVKQRMQKVADTIAFLSAWRITNSEELFARIQTSSPETRSFIEANLCRFSDARFRSLGAMTRQALRSRAPLQQSFA